MAKQAKMKTLKKFNMPLFKKARQYYFSTRTKCGLEESSSPNKSPCQSKLA